MYIVRYKALKGAIEPERKKVKLVEPVLWKTAWSEGIEDWKPGHEIRNNNIAISLFTTGTREFALVSPIEGKLIQDICQSARDSGGNSESYFAHQIESIGVDRRTAFRQFCEYLDLDSQIDTDRSEAFDYLRRLHIIHWEDDLGGFDTLKDLVRMLVSDDPETVIANLIEFAQNNLRKTISAGDVHSILVSRGLHPRRLVHDNRILPAIQKLKDQFIASIKPGLIAHELLPRTETQEVLKGLEEGGLVVLHGKAGSGKSGVLYELVTILEQRRQTYLPVRLDRQIPQNNPRQYGQILELPESPARCLEAVSGDKLSVLILDQLDAIRWTARHSLNALDVCKSLVSEIKTLQNLGKHVGVVLACRSFDLEHDPEIKAWLQGNAQQKLKKIEVKVLKEEDVKRVCGQKYDALVKGQRDLLRLPAHLAMWVQMVASGDVPSFKTGPQLLRQFWNNRRWEVEKAGIASSDIEFVLDELVRYMERNGCIAGPLSLVETKARALEALQSHGLLTKAVSSVSFAHQSYLDYQIASRILAEVNSGHGSVRNWLGDKSEQSLFRREQLRLVLTLLEEESPREFVGSIQELLEDENVRFHLKHLILELLSQLEDPSRALLDYLWGLINKDEWYDHLIETVCIRHAPYVLWLLRQGVLAQWLQADSEKDRDKALWLLRSVAENIPDEVVDLLESYAELDEEWKKRVLAGLCWNEESDSDRMFELRLRLAKSGVYKEWIDWTKLAAEYPDRAIRLIDAVLSTWDNDDLHSEEQGGSRSWFEKWTSKDLQGLMVAGKAHSNLVWDLLIPHLQRLATSEDENDDFLDLWHDRMLNRGHASIISILDISIEVGKLLAHQDSSGFFHRTEGLRDNPSRVIQYLLVECYSCMSDQLANECIEWLIEKPERLCLGPGDTDPEWMPAAQVIEAFSPFCSESTFRRLEHYLIHYHAPNEKRMAECYIKTWKEGYFGDFWGRAQYFLLPALDEQRRGPEVVGLIGVLRRKYAKYWPERFLRGPRISSGFLGSTLPHDKLSKISDRAWLENIIGNPNVLEEDHRGWRKAGDGGWRESSIGHFSRDLAIVAKRFPTRFAKLALRFSDDVHSYYVAAILEGLQQTRPPEGSEDEKARWAPASIELTEAVIARFLRNNDREVAKRFCSLLSTRSEENWSASILQRLISYATEHPDPEDGRLVVDSAGGDFNATKASAHDLQTNALNVVRGEAALAVGRLLWAHPDWLERFESAIDLIAVDKHPAVRVAAVEACLPVLNIDRKRAVHWFAQACHNDPRVTACRSAVYFFNCGMKTDRDLLEPLVRAMVDSNLTEVAQEGAKEVSGRWILYGYFEEELKSCMAGTVPHRKGVAQAAADLILKPEYVDRCRQLLETLMDDPDPTVRSAIGHAFRNKAVLSIPHSKEIVDLYLESGAYHDDPTPLFIAMKEYSGSLLPHTDLILGICREFAGPLRDASRDMSTGISGDVHMLLPLLLRLYEQAQEIEDKATINRCLDAWDILFEKRVGFVQELAQSLEQ